ncbi:MAG: winged helix DNA-binding domain-containing protein [Dermatophilaceae bacterium]
MARSRDGVIRRRLATQRVSGPGLRTGADVVRLLGAVQSQDAPLAAWSLALRMQRPATYAGLLAEQSTGGWVRTHILRPTWHLVAREDLRWMQRATAPRVHASMAGRRRQLGIDDDLLGRAVDVLRAELGGRRPRTRRELRGAFADAGLPTSVEHLAHLIMAAELDAMICSGPPRGSEHTYALVDEVVPAGPFDDADPADLGRELVRRFVAGHGPTADRDIARWCALTLTGVRAALSDLAGQLDTVRLDGDTQWFDPQVLSRTTRQDRAYLLPTFDEVALSYRTTGFPRREPAAARARLLSEAGGGIVIVDRQDVGVWKRSVRPTEMRVVVRPDLPLAAEDVGAVEEAAARLAAFVERPLVLEMTWT